jgi:hypothetical protein
MAASRAKYVCDAEGCGYATNRQSFLINHKLLHVAPTRGPCDGGGRGGGGRGGRGGCRGGRGGGRGGGGSRGRDGRVSDGLSALAVTDANDAAPAPKKARISARTAVPGTEHLVYLGKGAAQQAVGEARAKIMAVAELRRKNAPEAQIDAANASSSRALLIAKLALASLACAPLVAVDRAPDAAIGAVCACKSVSTIAAAACACETDVTEAIRGHVREFAREHGLTPAWYVEPRSLRKLLPEPPTAGGI